MQEKKLLFIIIFLFANLNPLICEKTIANDIIEFNTDAQSISYAIFQYIDNINDTDYLIRSNHKNISVELFNLNTRTLDKRAMLDLQNYFQAFLVKSMDSIFAIEHNKHILSMFNESGELLNQYDFTQLLNEKDVEYVIYANNNTPLIHVNNKFIFNIVANIPTPHFYEYPTIGIFDIEKGTLTKIANFPDFVQQGRIWMNFNPFYCLNNRNELVYSFAMSDSIYIYNLDNSVSNSVSVKSKYIDSIPPMTQGMEHNRKYNSEYQITQNFYRTLLYDKYKNLYYRVAVHYQDLVNEDGSINQYGSNPWSIIIMDSDFNIIDEVMMEPNKYRLDSLMVSKEGLLIQIQDELIESGNQLVFELFDLGGKQ